MVKMVKGATSRPAGQASRTGNTNVCIVCGRDGDAEVVAGKTPRPNGPWQPAIAAVDRLIARRLLRNPKLFFGQYSAASVGPKSW
jgi:hypothetical protein